MRDGDAQQRENLARRLEQMTYTPLSVEGAEDFLQVLAAWLRGHADQAAIKKLPPLFGDAFRKMVAAVEQAEVQRTPQTVNDDEESENHDDGQPLTLADLPPLAASVKQHGTREQCQQFAGQLAEVQQQLPAENAPLRQFLGCLIGALHDESPDTSSLVAPYTELWQAFHNALMPQTDEESEREHHG